MNRRDFVHVSLGAGAAMVIAPRMPAAMAAPVKMTVYKTPTCGCCKEWVKYVKDAGFDLTVVDMDDLSEVKRSAGVPDKLQACHTALVGNYVAEGHVPVDLIRKMLAGKPKIAGIAVPGMPVGAPGMEQGSTKQPFDVIAFDRNGNTSVYAKR